MSSVVTRRPASAEFVIERGLVERDRDGVVRLQERTLTTTRARETRRERFDRYYVRNPAGAPLFWVARRRDDQEIVGLFAVHNVTMLVDGRPERAGIPGDFAVDEAFRGAFGPAIPLYRAALADVDSADFAFLFGAPNDRSRPIVLASGFSRTGTIDLFVRPLRLARMLDHLDRGRPALRYLAPAADPALRVWHRDDRFRRRARRFGLRLVELTTFDERFDTLAAAARSSTARVLVARRREYLAWKYTSAAGLVDRPFRLLALVDRGDEVRGFAVGRFVDGGFSVVDLLCADGSAGMSQLLGHLIMWARRSGAASIGLRHCGADRPLPALLRSYGFHRVAGAPLATRVSPRRPDLAAIGSTASWHYMGGDGDI